MPEPKGRLMAKNDQQEAYAKLLESNLTRVIDLVKFAEAKNAALLAFASAWTVAIANLMAREESAPVAFAQVMPVSASLFLISALIALYSILPRADLSKFFRGEKRVSRDLNLLFYGDISKVEIDAYPERAKERYFPPEKHSATSEYLSDLSCQIHVNSTIANRKYVLFKVGAWITVISMAVLVWPATWYLIKGAIKFLVIRSQ